MTSLTPFLSEQQARDILVDHFNLNLQELRKMHGYEDVNYYVCAANAAGSIKEYVLKATLRDSAEDLDLQNTVMNHLRNSGFTVPEPMISREGKAILSFGTMRVRLLTYLPGTLLCDKQLNSSLLQQLGALAARMDKALQSVNHPRSHRELIWDLRYTPKIREVIGPLNAQDSMLILHVLNKFDQVVRPRTSLLRESIVHNDLHAMNVLTDGTKLTGVIDFGDVVHTWTINNPAICIAHLMMNQQNPIEVAQTIYHSYNSEFPLTHDEKQVLPYLILSRLAMLLAWCTYYFNEDRKNGHIESFIAPSRTLLMRLRSESRFLDAFK